MLDILYKFGKLVKKNKNEIILAIGVFLISLLSFSAGYITAIQSKKQEIRFESAADIKL